MIREQAAAKHLDPALIAAVIYAETKFEPRPSSAGAQGLMQILPATAYYLAHLSGGQPLHRQRPGHAAASTSPTAATTCATCSTTTTATRCWRVAAYNGGLANVDRWVAAARRRRAGS